MGVSSPEKSTLAFLNCAGKWLINVNASNIKCEDELFVAVEIWLKSMLFDCTYLAHPNAPNALV